VKTLDPVSTAEAKATILEARLADNSIVSTDCLRSTGQTSWRWTPSNSQALVPATLSQILFQSSGFPDQLRDKTNDDQLQTREEPYFTTANKEFLS